MATGRAQYRFTLLDEQGIQASLNMPVSIDTGTAGAGWATQAGLLDAVTGAQIIGGAVILPQAGTGKTSPAADSRVQETGVLDLGTAADQYVYGSIIPAILDSLLTSTHTQINESATAMAAYIAALTGGTFTNHAGQTLTHLVASFLSDRKHRRTLRQRSVRRP